VTKSLWQRTPTPVKARPAAPPPTPPPSPPPEDYKRVRTGRRWLRRFVLVALLILVVATAVSALPDLGGRGGAAQKSGPVSEQEVRDVADDFATAYGQEDSTALRATLARNVQRWLPSGETTGRDAVVREYGRQFKAQATRSYEISDLKVEPGSAARATGTYTVERDGRPPIKGNLVLGVVRENGRAKIALIAATPT
jgi:hypothetical protein